ncbi:nitroreductase [Caldalkalibacillus thermarum TA2.A1]|uniref:Putative NAD(P)H nitroreductase n=1 Tax=Caldalkalibacillus thermarum (strain TA2.A1) TaxID=986075 RepID=A0A8X8LA95_CALTT|nr:nitroreductase [Caldalkalibacillus thermarum]QZT32605.1 nitroreductase [Caldalkalibacillus thermarum TA2.A1]
MDVLKAIRTRRSIGKVKPDLVEKDKIEKILEAASWAPNHHMTEPWKFFVLTGEGRRPLGRTLAEIAKEGMEDPDTPQNREKLKRAEAKAFRAPVIIAVACTPAAKPNVKKIEEQAAVSAAIQNMLLTAHALGLGAIWRTGKPAYHPKMKALFGLKEEDELMGFIYLGYPDIEPPLRTRTPVEKKTIWIENDQPYA